MLGLQRLFGGRAINTRLRILGWYMLIMAVAMAFGLFLQRSILLAQLDDEINSELRQEVEELTQLTPGRNPATGEPFGDDVAAIFDTFLRRSVPVESEAMFTLVGGQPYASTVAPAQLMEDEAVVAVWRDVEVSTQAEIETTAGRVRYLAVPVLDTSQEIAGVFVVASFLDQRRDDIGRVVNIGAIVYGTTFVIASGLAWFAAGRALRPVGLLTRTARSVSDSNWTERIPVEGDDDLAELASTFNAMLDRLESAFSTQRRFLDDAGHELRTPITIIRGHLELLGEDSTATAETRRLVLDELDRMARLVDDLLLLARAEQPDFLDVHPLDVAELMDEIAAKAGPIAENPITVVERANLVIDVERQRLTQVLMNLVRNAIVHTPAETEVRIGSRYGDGSVELWVEDDGEGIAPPDQDRIFDRFARGQSSRRSTGSGLGLSIVKVIAEAHGGAVYLDSEANQGARFTIVLPATLPDEAGEEEEELWT